MTPWMWWAEIGDGGERDLVGEYTIEAESREVAIEKALRETRDGDAFEIIEARSSTAAKFEGADIVPFVRSRNRARFFNRGGVPERVAIAVPANG